MKLLVLALTAATLLAQSPRKQASPLDQLPADIEMLTSFGERADLSPANTEVAFMAKSFGDAFVIRLSSRTAGSIHRC
jgi:hypothetical protein